MVLLVVDAYARHMCPLIITQAAGRAASWLFWTAVLRPRLKRVMPVRVAAGGDLEAALIRSEESPRTRCPGRSFRCREERGTFIALEARVEWEEIGAEQ